MTTPSSSSEKGRDMQDPMRKPITTLTDADWVALTPLFNRRVTSEWPFWTRRLLKALHLPESMKLALCWEEYNVVPSADRDRIFRTLDVPGSFLVPLDNAFMRGIGKVMGAINPVSWVLKWADRQFEITSKVREALQPLAGIAAGLPASNDRNKDARAWRQVLTYAPTQLATVIVRMIISDVALDIGIEFAGEHLGWGDDTAVDASTDAAFAAQYDPSAASAGAGGHAFASHHAVLHAGQVTHLAAELRTAGSAAMTQVTGAFQPLLTTLHHAHAHGVRDATSYANEVLGAAHRSWQNLPDDLRHAIHTIHSISELGWEEIDREVIAFTAF